MANQYTIEQIKPLYNEGPHQNSPSICVFYTSICCAPDFFFLPSSMGISQWAMFNSSGFKASWTMSWTVRLRLQTSESSSIGTIMVFMLTPDAASDNACKNLELSTSVTAVFGINETLFFAHSKACTPYARTRAISAYVTCKMDG